MFFSEEAKNNTDLRYEVDSAEKDLCSEPRARFDARGPVSPALSFAMVSCVRYLAVDSPIAPC